MTTNVLNAKLEKLIIKTDYISLKSDIEAKYFTTSDFNKLTSKILVTKISEKGLVDKYSISSLVIKFRFKYKTSSINN